MSDVTSGSAGTPSPKSPNSSANRSQWSWCTSSRATRSLRVVVPDMPIAANKYLTIADVCAELGIARLTFYDWRAAKKAPPCLKLRNGEIRVRRVDLDRWLASLEEVA